MHNDEEAFRALYELYEPPLVLVAQRYVWGPDMAADIVQDVFFNVWVHRAVLDSPIGPYLYRAVLNRAANARGRRRMVDRYDAQALSFQPVSGVPKPPETPVEILERRDLEARRAQVRAALHAAMRALPTTQREIVERRLQGHKPAAIGAALDKSPKTISNLYGQAVKTLRAYLEAAGF
jgi:RNA polymerase sigma factor (sigma-70 family)